MRRLDFVLLDSHVGGHVDLPVRLRFAREDDRETTLVEARAVERELLATLHEHSAPRGALAPALDIVLAGTCPQRQPACGNLELQRVRESPLQRCDQRVAALVIDAPRAANVTLDMTVLDQLGDRGLDDVVAVAIGDGALLREPRVIVNAEAGTTRLADGTPAVLTTITGRAWITGIHQYFVDPGDPWPEGYVTPNRRMVYAALNWCQEHHTEIIDTLRTLAGAAPLQMPASIDLVADPQLKDRFERWWSTSSMPALDRLKLYKLVWDLIGSEFAGRHMLYERFYAGNSIIVRNQSDREAPWEKFHDIVDGLLERVRAQP